MSKRNVPWTSIQAFLNVLPKLGGQRRMVLEWMLEWIRIHGHNPTANELADWSEKHKPEGRWKENLQRVRRRLNELRDVLNAIHNTKDRKCTVAKNEQKVWVPGPSPGTTLPQRKTPVRPRKTPQQLLSEWSIPFGQKVNCPYANIIPLIEAAMEEGANYPSP